MSLVSKCRRVVSGTPALSSLYEDETIMKKSTLLLAFLIGLHSGYANSGEVEIFPLGSDSVAVYSKDKIDDIIKSSLPPVLPWEPLISENICVNCRANAGGVVSLNRMGLDEDLVYNVAKALRQYRSEQPPPHAWEENAEIQ